MLELAGLVLLFLLGVIVGAVGAFAVLVIAINNGW